MDKQNKEEKVVGKLMQKSLVEMPFRDFEDRLMAKIVDEKQRQKSVSNTIRIAWIFFCLGLFFGLLITSLVANLEQLIIGIPAKKLAFGLQIGIAVILLLQFDKLLDFTIKRKED
ncbi:hypothetical protein ACUNWD_09505 [Sunxiuqinia sp. A32]|uniref:hypothetical protein n=1 Tax=Sunxiuqinia sp. A32 TaxID=3461496 RepID=UPI004045735F